MKRLLALTIALAALTGCGSVGYWYSNPDAGHCARCCSGWSRWSRLSPFDGSCGCEEPEPVVVTKYIYVRGSPPRPPAPAGPSSFDEVAMPAFDWVGARGALHEVGLRACRVEHGAPRGFGHATVTFGASGRVSHVEIDAPPGLGADAVACIGGKLGGVSVAPFRGGEVKAGFVYDVE